MRDATLVFDLDGTLVDTAPDLVGATNHVLAGLGLAPRPQAELRPWISFGARRMIVEALAASGEGRSEREVDHLLERFLDHYVENIAVLSRPFAGAVDALHALRGRGARLAVCTNKREALAIKLLDLLGLSAMFAAIAGRDTFPVCKPHPDHLLGTIQRAGGTRSRAVMIGDSGVDVATARAAGIAFVGVGFGYTDTPIRQLGPDETIDCYTELEAALGRVLAGG